MIATFPKRGCAVTGYIVFCKQNVKCVKDYSIIKVYPNFSTWGLEKSTGSLAKNGTGVCKIGVKKVQG